MPERAFLDYFALVVTLAGLTMVIMAFMWLHEFPHRIAEQRNHPQKEAIHVACWLSLCTLHAIWPFVFIWAVSKTGPLPVSVRDDRTSAEEIGRLRQRLAELEAREQAAATVRKEA